MKKLEKIINSVRSLVKASFIAGAIGLALFIPNNVRAEKPIHGICYGPFRDGQDPNRGIFPNEDQIQEDISIITPHSEGIRTYGNDNILHEIPRLCEEAEIKCQPGAWISQDDSLNRVAVRRLIGIAYTGYNCLSGLIVGSEVLLRNDIEESNLIEYIQDVNSATDIPVTTADTWGVYLDHPHVAEAVDYLLVHVHPYWEGIDVENTAEYVIDRWQQLRDAYPEKEIVLGEIGWPTAGDAVGDAVPSEENQTRFIGDFLRLANRNRISYFLFEAFDESWKRQAEGEVGAHWGLWNTDRTPKPFLEGIIANSFSKIIFCERENIWIANPNGTGLTQIADGDRGISRIKFSPDGNMIAFTKTDTTQQIINLEGNVFYEYSINRNWRSNQDFAWSPDGSSVLFGAYFYGLYRYTLDDGRLNRLFSSANRTYDHNPAVSPNLEKIAYVHHEYGSNYYIYVRDADGQNPVLITNGSGTSYDEQLDLDWLDNNYIIFKINPKDSLYCYNTETRNGAGINPHLRFSNMKLSADKTALVLYGGSKVYLADTTGLRSGEFTLTDSLSESRNNTAALSGNGNYIVTPSNEGIRIFDREHEEYHFLPRENLPDGMIYDIDWSNKPIGNLVPLNNYVPPAYDAPHIIQGSAHPNPCAGRQYIMFNYASPQEDVILTIHDICGREVRRLYGAGNGRHNEILWDVKNGLGRDVAPGVYFYTLTPNYKNISKNAEAGKIGKIVLLR